MIVIFSTGSADFFAKLEGRDDAKAGSEGSSWQQTAYVKIGAAVNAEEGVCDGIYVYSRVPYSNNRQAVAKNNAASS
jgi:hypothetical protein